MILPHIRFDEEFFRLLKELGEYDKKALANLRYPIDFDPSQLAASLKKMVYDKVYKNDYETVTMPLLFKKVSYEDAARSLSSAADKMGYEEGEFVIDPPMNFTLRRRTAKA